MSFLDCFVPRNDDACNRHCEERSNPVKNSMLKRIILRHFLLFDALIEVSQ